MQTLPDFTLSEDEIRELRRHLRTPGGGIPGSGYLSFEQESSEPVRIVAPYDFTHHFRVKRGEAGSTVLALLCQRFPFRSSCEWEKKITAGLIRVNGQDVSPAHILKQNDEISHRNIGVVEPSVPDDIRILRDYEDYLVADKPAPIPMHSGGRYNRNTVVHILDEMGYPDLKIIHRLDAVTSGMVIFAKSESAANRISVQLERGASHKTYEAIVKGNPAVDEVIIDRGIKRLKGFVFTCSGDEDAKSAVTRFQVLYQGDGWAHVGCEPVTGRTHQIRLHLAHWGHPIWDDSIYNGSMDVLGVDKYVQSRAISLVSTGMRFGAD